MRVAHQQRWNLTPRAAVALQRRLAENVATKLERPLPGHPLVAGADISYDQRSDRLFAAVIILQLPGLEVVEQSTHIDRARFPYIPGLLSFREAPALLKAFQKLRTTPDVVLIDGQGLAHPRRFGIASHLGWLLELPTVGCAKSILCGEYGKLSVRRGARASLIHKDEVIGSALRTRRGVQPVYVSIGHKINLATAEEIVLRCAPKFRIPEPTRQAHILVNQLRLS